ncbi:Bacterial alpha-L-rhamnosidase [compost metagenome]
MYGRPFGKSLCHAWGASPIYLLGKYYLGVSPDSPGYETYTIEPNLGGLAWMEGKVPTANGDIAVYMNKKEIRINAAVGTGKLRIKSKSKPVANGAEIKSIGNNLYEITIEKGRNYSVRYNY